MTPRLSARLAWNASTLSTTNSGPTGASGSCASSISCTSVPGMASATVASLSRHFGSKLGLYGFVREDVERRLLDRMEGAVAAAGGEGDRSAAVRAALL